MTGLPSPWGTIVLVVEVSLFAYFVACNAFYAFTTIVAVIGIPRFVHVRRADLLPPSYSTLDPPVSVIIPAYNEEELISASIRSLLALEYSTFEIVVVNDGSTDGTLARLTEDFELEPYPGIPRVVIPTRRIRGVYRSVTDPSLLVVDKENGGKSDALNAGLNLSRFPLVFAGDADSRYDPATLRIMAEPLVRDRHTVGVGSAIGVADDRVDRNDTDEASADVVAPRGRPRLPRSLLARFQALDYLRSFLATRMGWAPFNALAIVSGASSLWRKQVLLDAGGYRTDTMWEDMEITLRVHNMLRARRVPYRVAFVPYPVCWTEVPRTVGDLYRQRKGWSRHLCESLVIHRRLLRHGGVLGWAGMPFLVLFEWLSPVCIAFGLVFTALGLGFGFLSVSAQLVLLALVLILAMQVSLVSVLLDQISYNIYGGRLNWPLVSALVLENLGYRQVVWTASLAGMLSWILRRPLRPRSAPDPAAARPPGVLVPAYRPAERAAGQPDRV